MEFVVPIGGLEVDVLGQVRRREYVEFQVWVGGQSTRARQDRHLDISLQPTNRRTGSLTWTGEFREVRILIS